MAFTPDLAGLAFDDADSAVSRELWRNAGSGWLHLVFEEPTLNTAFYAEGNAKLILYVRRDRFTLLLKVLGLPSFQRAANDVVVLEPFETHSSRSAARTTLR